MSHLSHQNAELIAEPAGPPLPAAEAPCHKSSETPTRAEGAGHNQSTTITQA